jgi:hypothetical protein
VPPTHDSEQLKQLSIHTTRESLILGQTIVKIRNVFDDFAPIPAELSLGVEPGYEIVTGHCNSD